MNWPSIVMLKHAIDINKYKDRDTNLSIGFSIAL